MIGDLSTTKPHLRQPVRQCGRLNTYWLVTRSTQDRDKASSCRSFSNQASGLFYANTERCDTATTNGSKGSVTNVVETLTSTGITDVGPNSEDGSFFYIFIDF